MKLHFQGCEYNSFSKCLHSQVSQISIPCKLILLVDTSCSNKIIQPYQIWSKIILQTFKCFGLALQLFHISYLPTWVKKLTYDNIFSEFTSTY